VSRRWDLLRPLIGEVLADCVLAPAQVVGKGGTLLVDGTIAPAWDWASVPDLYSGKAGYPGMNIQVAATLSGDVAAIGPVPVHGARHDAHAYAASGLKDLITGHDTIADLGYTGVEGITTVPYRTPPGGTLHHTQVAFNTGLSAIRACHRAGQRPPQNLADDVSIHGFGCAGRLRVGGPGGVRCGVPDLIFCP